MKVFTALLGTETNTFSPVPTGMADFEEFLLVRGGTANCPPDTYTSTLQLWRRRAEARGWSVCESLCAFAYPSGLTSRACYEALRDEILEDLAAALPVGMVLLNLHGAMVAEGYDDCSGDLIGRIRTLVGPDVPIGVELDLHCHTTRAMLDSATLLVAYKEFPHSDFAERAEEVFALTADAAGGRTRPVMAAFDCRCIGFFPTTAQPLRGFVDRMQALEGRDGILSVSLGHGYPWGDVPEAGAKVIVVADGDAAKAEALARRLGEEFYSLREAAQPPFMTIDEAFARAAEIPAGRPVVLTDVADGPSGGSPGDSTFLLRALLERGVQDAALSILWDPVAVQFVFRAGEGARLRLRLGGKTGTVSGEPIDLDVEVTRLVREAWQVINGARTSFGDAALLRHGGIDIVVGSKRLSVISRHTFSNLGIDPATRRFLVVKGQHGFYNDYAPIAAAVLYVGTPGACQPLFREATYRRLRRPIWPFDPDPLELDSRR